MENEEEEDEIFTALQGGYEGQEDVEEQEEEEEQEEPEAERKSSWDVPIPSRSLASRRASLPCPVCTQYKFLCVCVACTSLSAMAHDLLNESRKTPVALGQAVDLSYRQPTSS